VKGEKLILATTTLEVHQLFTMFLIPATRLAAKETWLRRTKYSLMTQ
jgi:hypothetical protein